MIYIYNVFGAFERSRAVKRIAALLSVVIPLIAVIVIAVTVYAVYPSLSRTDLYNLAISLLVILISGVAVFSALSLKKDVKEQ